MSNVQIIFLNGPSSVGKTTIAKELQSKLSEPYLHIGIDNLIEMMPAHINSWEGGRADQGFWWEKSVDSQGNSLAHIRLGTYAQQVTNLLGDLVTTMASKGFKVIVDDVCVVADGLEVWRETLHSFKCLFVGIHSSTEVLERREAERGNRMLGSARTQNSTVHKNNVYDLEIDTSAFTFNECVDKILSKARIF